MGNPTILEGRRTAKVCPIFKKENPTNTEDHRGISILDSFNPDIIEVKEI